jgi:lipoprotein-releasing system ATP-binding protein
LNGISKSYHIGRPNQIDVLTETSFDLAKGEIVALVAPSGAGKSTLLHIAGLLDTPDSGSVRLNGEELSTLSDRRRTNIRRNDMGFVYQFHHLLPEFSACENIILPQLANGVKQSEAMDRAQHLLSLVGLKDRFDHRPAEMSGGEQQRVAFCRALANEPQILLADEPTGNLDQATSDTVFETLIKIVRETGLSALIATHNPDLAARMDRTVELNLGKLIQRERR